jgi:hypothetical protein
VTDSVNKTIQAFSIESWKSIGSLKCSNANVGKLLIDSEENRLYCSAKEGLLLFFDIKTQLPRLCYTMRLVKVPELGRNYVKSMDLDKEKKLLVLRMKNSDVLLIQVIEA